MEASYQAFHTESDNESEDLHHDNTVRIHIPPASRVTRWSHIEDLDSFFTRVYVYHQRHGFVCILLRGVFELVKVIFTVVFCVFLLYFVDYDILFHNKLPGNNTNTADKNVQSPQPMAKITLSDALCPLDRCFNDISVFVWICINLVTIFWFFRLIKLLYNLYHFWDIKGFYNVALKIPDEQLDNITWHEVEKKVCDVQKEQHMCIRKTDLTELDIYHRILRSKNYMVAMVNKSLLPIHHNIPFIGTVCYLSQGLKYNIELLLFSGTWGFFDNWNLKEDYKKFNKRHELAAKLQTTILWFAIGNLFFGVFIFIWQLVYFFFNYAEVLKREPGVLGLRCWSLYGRLYLRHFNEVDHELDARLRRAYRPASKYMNTFSSPIMIIIAQNVIFIAGSMLAVLVGLTVYDEDVILVEHVLTTITVLGVIIALCRAVIPDENMCWCPETLMIEVLAEVHYLPDSWRGYAHTTQVRDQFSQFFQYRATNLLYELISPVVTPLIFYFKLRPKSLEIIDFYRNFTVTIVGVGDVCSFALMDMRKHGNPTWQTVGQLTPEINRQNQAEDGKTELSLIHFATMNPMWQPPPEAQQFLEEIREKSKQQLVYTDERDKHIQALSSVTTGLSMIASAHPLTKSNMTVVHTSRVEGPLMERSFARRNSTLLRDSEAALYEEVDGEIKAPYYVDTPAVNMSVNTLYLHSLHHKKIHEDEERSPSPARRHFSAVASTSSVPLGSVTPSNSSVQASEGTPLLKNVPKIT